METEDEIYPAVLTKKGAVIQVSGDQKPARPLEDSLRDGHVLTITISQGAPVSSDVSLTELDALFKNMGDVAINYKITCVG